MYYSDYKKHTKNKYTSSKNITNECSYECVVKAFIKINIIWIVY